MITLVAQSPDAPLARLVLQPGINTLGRSEGNHLVLPHGSISGRHCEIVVEDGVITVQDLGSTNGTSIEERPVTRQVLAHGQRIRFGALEYLCEAPASAAPRASGLRVNIPPPPAVATPKAPEIPVVRRVAPPVVPEPMSFFRGLPSALLYPLRTNGLLLLVIGSVVFLILEFLSRYSGIISIIMTGYLFAYMQKIVAHSAQGEDELPDFPEFSEWWSDIILPFLLFVGTFAASFAPALAVYFLLRGTLDETGQWFAVGAAGLAGAVYFPMALMAVAVSDNFLALSPHIVVPSMFRVFLPYGVMLLALAALVGVRVGAHFAMEFIPVPMLPAVVLGFLSLYVLVVEMRILGLFFRAYRDRLGWLS
jgi:hypothetical protein